MVAINNLFAGPLALWSFATVAAVISCSIEKNLYRSPVVRATFIPIIFGLLCYVMNGLIQTEYASIFSKIATCRTIFDIISRSFGPAPGLIAYLLISKKRGIKTGIWIAYVGCLWIFIMLMTGFMVTLLQVDTTYLANSSYDFAYCGQSGFALLFVLLMLIHWNTLPDKANISLMAYSVLIILSEIFKLVIYFVYTLKALDYYIIELIFVELTMVSSLMLAVWFGPLWTKYELLDDKDEEELAIDDEETLCNQ